MPVSEENTDRELPLIEHLRELRVRLLRAAAMPLVIFGAISPFASRLYILLAMPLLESLPEGNYMIATEVTSPFLAPFKLGFFFAIFLSIPWILHQFWLFAFPGMYSKERRLVLPVLFGSVFLFYLGSVFAYFLVLPTVFSFFAAVAPPGVKIMTDIHHYLDFIIAMFFAFGFAFEIPLLTWTLLRAGIVEGDALRANRHWVILSAFVIGMLLTPPDLISQIMLAVPVWLLFELGLFWGDRGRKDVSS
ncbi:MAG: twin-arginine translocase subunit TatC [Candidatus Eutrophobiaceae bacterium]